MASKDITQSGTNSIKNNNQPSSEEINSNVNQNSNPQNNQTSQQKSPNLPIQEDTDSSLSPLDPEEILDNDEIFSQTKSKRKHIESFKKYVHSNSDIQEQEFWRFKDNDFELSGRF